MTDYAHTICSSCGFPTAHKQSVEGGPWVCTYLKHKTDEEELQEAIFRKVAELLKYSYPEKSLDWVNGLTFATREITFFVMNHQLKRAEEVIKQKGA